jgi:hypothetical protein
MPNLYFLIFELIIHIQFALCLRHAWKSDTLEESKLIITKNGNREEHAVNKEEYSTLLKSYFGVML